jgi:hypothetical protein
MLCHLTEAIDEACDAGNTSGRGVFAIRLEGPVQIMGQAEAKQWRASEISRGVARDN